LVIAGDADHETEYSLNLKEMATKDKRVFLTGYITGESLKHIFSHARLFVLPSYHEGLPIALLEAMSYDLSVLVSDIPANREVDLSKERYFKRGDIDDLRGKLRYHLARNICEEEKQAYRQLIAEKYNWDRITAQTIAVYEKAGQDWGGF
jgi:starch synthase